MVFVDYLPANLTPFHYCSSNDTRSLKLLFFKRMSENKNGLPHQSLVTVFLFASMFRTTMFDATTVKMTLFYWFS